MVKLKFCKATCRPVPYAFRPKIEATIDRLSEFGIIEPIQFSEWATPIVPVLVLNWNALTTCLKHYQVV